MASGSDCEIFPTNEDNLCHRAARLFFEGAVSLETGWILFATSTRRFDAAGWVAEVLCRRVLRFLWTAGMAAAVPYSLDLIG